jgi:hypothetical protein
MFIFTYVSESHAADSGQREGNRVPAIRSAGVPSLSGSPDCLRIRHDNIITGGQEAAVMCEMAFKKVPAPAMRQSLWISQWTRPFPTGLGLPVWAQR